MSGASWSWRRHGLWLAPLLLVLAMGLSLLAYVNRHCGTHRLRLLNQAGDGTLAVLEMTIPWTWGQHLDWSGWVPVWAADLQYRIVSCVEQDGELRPAYFLSDNDDVFAFTPATSDFWNFMNYQHFVMNVDFASGSGEWGMGDETPWDGVLEVMAE